MRRPGPKQPNKPEKKARVAFFKASSFVLGLTGGHLGRERGIDDRELSAGNWLQ